MIFIILLAIFPLLGAVAPRWMAGAPFLLATTGLILYRSAIGGWPRISLKPFYYVLPVIALGGLSTFWALDPEFALLRTGKMAVILLPGALLIGFLLCQKSEFYEGFGAWFLLFYAIALTFCVIEVSSGAPVYKFFNETTDTFNFSVLNRGVVVVTLATVYAFTLFFLMLDSRKTRLFTYAIMTVLLIILADTTESQSATLALVIMAGAFFLFPVRCRWSWFALTAALAALIFSAPFLAQFLFHTLPEYIQGSYFFEHASALQRLEIWDFIARYALEEPLHGFGLEAARAVESFDTQQLYHADDTILHPHNFALQAWIEFGIVGAAAAALFLGFLIHDIRRLPAGAARMSLAALLGCLSVAATAYGFWQSWWLGTLIIIAAYGIVLSKLLSATVSREAR